MNNTTITLTSDNYGATFTSVGEQTATEFITEIVIPMMKLLGYHPISIAKALLEGSYEVEELIESIKTYKGESDE